MNRKTLVGLSLCYLVGFTIGNGFLPLMPIYAEKLGATREIAGYYLAFAFLCVSAGSMLGGRLSDLTRYRRHLLAAAGIGLLPLTWVIGRVANIWQLALANGTQWLLGGMCLGIVGAIAGKQAGENERGRIFGILGITVSLGSVLGGLTFGKMVDAWGYAGMSNVATLFGAITPVAALILVNEGQPAHDSVRGSAMLPGAARWAGAAFVFLIVAEVLGNSVTGPGNLGRSLSMGEKSFSNAAITITMAVGGLISLPFPFILGRLSDAVGRKGIMIGSFLAGIASLLLLVVARSLWQFWAVAALMSINAVSTSIGPAFVADVVRKERVGTGISLFQSSAWVGTIVGLVYSGIAFQRVGISMGVAIGAAFPVLGILALFLVRTRSHSMQPATLEKISI